MISLHTVQICAILTEWFGVIKRTLLCIPTYILCIQIGVIMNRSRVKVFPGTSICSETMLKGDITFGVNCVVHPFVQILAIKGPIIIGENCVIEERVRIIHRSAQGETPTIQTGPPLVIGSNNIFEVGCRIEAKRIGDNNIFESNSLVGNKVTVLNDCVIGAGCKFNTNSVLEEKSVVYGQNCTLRKSLNAPSQHPGFIETMHQILLKNHRLLRVTHRHQSSRCNKK